MHSHFARPTLLATTLNIHDILKREFEINSIFVFNGTLCDGLSVGTCFFFFFQAEDGIRDKLVTGVQTCALPISCFSKPRSAPRAPASTRSVRIGRTFPRTRPT